MGAMEDSANGNAKRRFAVIATVPVNMGSCIGRATIRAGWLAVPTSLFEVLYARFLSGEFLKYLYNFMFCFGLVAVVACQQRYCHTHGRI